MKTRPSRRKSRPSPTKNTPALSRTSISAKATTTRNCTPAPCFWKWARMRLKRKRPWPRPTISPTSSPRCSMAKAPTPRKRGAERRAFRHFLGNRRGNRHRGHLRAGLYGPPVGHLEQDQAHRQRNDRRRGRQKARQGRQRALRTGGSLRRMRASNFQFESWQFRLSKPHNPAHSAPPPQRGNFADFQNRQNGRLRRLENPMGFQPIAGDDFKREGALALSPFAGRKGSGGAHARQGVYGRVLPRARGLPELHEPVLPRTGAGRGTDWRGIRARGGGLDSGTMLFGAAADRARRPGRVLRALLLVSAALLLLQTLSRDVFGLFVLAALFGFFYTGVQPIGDALALGTPRGAKASPSARRG